VKKKTPERVCTSGCPPLPSGGWIEAVDDRDSAGGRGRRRPFPGGLTFARRGRSGSRTGRTDATGSGMSTTRSRVGGIRHLFVERAVDAESGSRPPRRRVYGQGDLDIDGRRRTGPIACLATRYVGIGYAAGDGRIESVACSPTLDFRCCDAGMKEIDSDSVRRRWLSFNANRLRLSGRTSPHPQGWLAAFEAGRDLLFFVHNLRAITVETRLTSVVRPRSETPATPDP